MPVNQSLWTHDLLWSKARAYMGRAQDVHRDDVLFPFWSSLTLEFLARAALASVHPALVADTSEPDIRNILHAFGRTPKLKGFVPKSAPMNEVIARCEQLIPEFTTEMARTCRAFASARNEELHSGGTPFAAIGEGWLLRFYEIARVLLSFQGKALTDLLGPQEAMAAEKLLAAATDEAAKSVNKTINAHSEVWKNKLPEERTRLTSQASKAAKGHLGHVVNCPACGSQALLQGEEIRQQPPVLENDVIVIRTLMLPNSFRCTACELQIEGHGRLLAAGLGAQFTNTARVEPLDYYASEDGDDEGFDFNWNNE